MQLSNDIAEPVGALRPALDDEDLLPLFRAGNRDAASLLIDRHSGRLVNTLFWHTGRKESQAETAARVLVAALNRCRMEDPAVTFTVTLYDTMRTHTEDMRRSLLPRFARRARKSSGLTEAGEKMLTALQALDISLRLTFVLSVIAGLPYVDVAAVTGVPPWTVKDRLGEARRQLHEALVQKGIL